MQGLQFYYNQIRLAIVQSDKIYNYKSFIQMGQWMRGLANDVADGICRLKSWLLQHRWKVIGVVGGAIILGAVGTYCAPVIVGASVSGMLGVSAEVIGGVGGAVIGGVAGGLAGTFIPKLFKYFKRRRQVYQARQRAEHESNAANIRVDDQTIEWEPLQVGPQALQIIEAFLDVQKFKEDADRLLCPIKKRVISRPAQVTCCGKLYELSCIRNHVTTNHQCPNCFTPIDQTAITDESAQVRDKKRLIVGLRVQIRITYNGPGSDQLKKEWERAIDEKMGEGYVDRYL